MKVFSTHPSDEGTTNWHLLALGLLEPWRAREFIESTVDATGTQLVDDLLEHTTRPIVRYKNGPSVPAGLGVEEMCRIQKSTLLGHYIRDGALDWQMHDVVRGFERWLEVEIRDELSR